MPQHPPAKVSNKSGIGTTAKYAFPSKTTKKEAFYNSQK
jgi:hypothetical protein